MTWRPGRTSLPIPQCGEEGSRIRPPLPRRALQRPLQDRSQTLGDTGPVGLLVRDRDRPLASSDRFEEDGAETVNVRLRRCLPTELLGRHVRGGTDRQAALCERLTTRSDDRLRDPEVGDERVVVGEHDVGGLDVAVDHALAVCVVQAAGHVSGDADGPVRGQPALSIQSLAQRFPIHARHDVVQKTAGDARVEQGEDVRVLEVRRKPDLALEPLGSNLAGQSRVYGLDRHPPPVFGVHRQVHGPHAALAQGVLEIVPAAKLAVQDLLRIDHGRVTARIRIRVANPAPRPRPAPSSRP